MWDRLGLGWRSALIIPACAIALLLALVPNPFTSKMESLVLVGRDGSAEGVDIDGGFESLEITRLKGSLPELYLFRKTDSGAEALRPGSAVRAGDLIQVQYDAAGRKYGAVFSVDGSGKVTWHLPERGNQSAILSPTGRIALKSAFELDEAPGRENFHFVTSEHPFLLGSAADAVVKNRSIAAMTHTFFALTKDTLK